MAGVEEPPRHPLSWESVVGNAQGDSMNTQANHLVGLVLAPLLGACLLAGCGDDRSAGDGRTKSQSLKTQEKRAREVADAWPGSAAAAAWSRGYYPMADTTQPPESGWHNEADKRAFESGTIVRSGKLPTTAITQGKVAWRSGSTLSRPLMEPKACPVTHVAG